MSPIPPPTLVPSYDLWESALQLARTRLNDAIASLGGEVLTDTSVFTQTMVVGAWRKFQTFLAQLGHSRFKQRAVLFNMQPFNSTDPSSLVSLTWTYYFDGTSFWVPPTVSVLPADLILPLKIWARQSPAVGQNPMPFPNEPIPQALDGLQNLPRPRPGWMNEWEWRGDAIYMQGSQYTMDLQIEYAAFLPDPVTPPAGVPWYSTATPPASNQLIPIMRALSPLSLYIAAECSVGRADAETATMKAEAEDETKQLFNIEAQQKQRTSTSRKRFSEQIRPRYGGGYGYYH